MPVTAAQREHILDLTEEFLRVVYHRPLPPEWAEADLTMPQLRVLLTLYLEGPQSCGSLADNVGLSLPTLTGILERLSRRGYLVRTHDDRDRRRVISSLSLPGEHLVSRLWTAHRDQLAVVLETLNPEELKNIEASFALYIEAIGRLEPLPSQAVASR
jgi:DNA-binding MarR family transcriptional regulator